MLNIINYFLLKINSLDGFLHWTTQRFTALTVFFFFPVILFFGDIYFLLGLSFFLAYHVLVGIRTLIDDYIHDDILFLVSNTFLRIITIFSFKTIFIIFIC